MIAVNKVWVGGVVKGDVMVIKTNTGKEYGTMVIAITEPFLNRDGQEQEETTMVEVKFFGRQIEAYQQRFGNGVQAFIEGKVQGYVSKDNKIYLSIKCIRAQVVGPSKAQAAEEEPAPAAPSAPAPATQQEYY